MVKQNYKIGVSTVLAGILSIITFYVAFVNFQTSLLSSVVLVIAALLILPFLYEMIQEKLKKKTNITISTPLRWIAWFVLTFFVALILR